MAVQTTPQRDKLQIHTGAVWFGDGARPALGWISRPVAGVGQSGVVIAPPVGYEYWSGHRTLRTLAERLAHDGHCVLRFDYDGTGDSAGDQWDPDRVDTWRATLALAADQLRRLGLTQITLIGARLGATFALLDGAAIQADRIVAWLPLASGRRYVKELKLLSTPVPEECDSLSSPGTRTFAGSVFSAATLEALRDLDSAGAGSPPAPSTLVIDDRGGSAEPVVSQLLSLGGRVEHLKLDGHEESLRTAPEFATVPTAILDAICDWLGNDSPVRVIAAAGTDATGEQVRLEWRGASVTETVLRLPGRGHVGFLTEPSSGPAAATTLVLLNPGSESHVGPGRAWVELARDLALAGRQTIRIDFVGWGESPDRGDQPGHPYDESCEQDSVAIVDALREAGFGRVALCGLCASAWIALRVAASAAPAGIIALNPQMYWERGDPVDIDWDVIRGRRADQIRRIERGARARIWSLLDVLGHRSPQGRWLDELAATGIPVHLVFAEGDDGLKYLSERLARRLSRASRPGTITVSELPGVDHPMHLTWMRPRVVDALSAALAAIDAHPA